MFASVTKLHYRPLQCSSLKAIQSPIGPCVESFIKAMDCTQTAPFHINHCNQHASSTSEREESMHRLRKLEFLWMTNTRRSLWSVRATGSSADGLPASNFGYSTPKSDEEWSEILFPSKDGLSSSADLTSEGVDRRLASSTSSDTFSEISGNAGIAVPQLIDSTSQAASEHSTAFPSTGSFEASFDSTIQSQRLESESKVARLIVDFRFLTMMAVIGFLAASCLCFVQGCAFICQSYATFYTMCMKRMHTGRMVLYLVEALDVFLAGTVMLILGMGLYGLFISNIPTNLCPNEDRALRNSSLFGFFYLQERPKWMKICSLDELKSKLGHLIVMILLVKMFERSKAISICTGVDLFSYSISIFLSSAALFVLNKLQ